jgi:hypothetical protein
LSSVSSERLTQPSCDSIAASWICHSAWPVSCSQSWRVSARTRDARPKAAGLTSEITSVSTLMLPLSVFCSSSRSPVTRRNCAMPAVSAAARSSGAHGLVRKRKMRPSLMAASAVSSSECPVSMIRTVSGDTRCASARKRTPSSPGMRRSDTTTA